MGHGQPGRNPPLPSIYVGLIPTIARARCSRDSRQDASATVPALREFNFGGHRSIGHYHAVPAFSLGAIERSIGGLQQFLRGGSVLRKLGHADRNSNRSERLPSMRHRQLSKPATNSFGASPGYVQACHGQDDDKLLPAKAANHIFRANTFQQEGSALTQDRVARIMTEGIVELFEVIQIEHEK